MEVIVDSYKETKVGRVPVDWKVLKLSKVYDFIRTSSHSKNEMTYGTTESTIYNIHYGAIHTTYKEQILDFDKYHIPKITDNSTMPRESQFLRDGDLVIVDASEDADGLGECVELKNVRSKKVIGGLHTYAVRDKNGLVAKGFGGYIFKHHSVKSRLVRCANISKVYGITKSNISSLPIVLPPLPEQRKIAEILSTVDQQIQITRDIIDQTKLLKKGLMQKLFTEGISHTRFKETKIGRLPESWEVCQLKDNLDLITYGFTNPMPTTNEGPYMLTAKDIRNGAIEYKSCRKTTWDSYHNLLTEKSRPVIGDILLTKDGTLGRVAIVDRNDLCINQSVALLRPKTSASPNFLKYLLESPYYQKRMIQDAGGSTIKHIYITVVDKMKVAIPPKTEQAQIVEILTQIDGGINFDEGRFASLTQLKRGLMQVLLTGKLRVTL